MFKTCLSGGEKRIVLPFIFGHIMRVLVRKAHLCLLLAIISCAQTSENKTLAPDKSAMMALEAALMELDADSAMRYGNLAISVKNVRTGQALLEQNTRKAMVIASNMKLVTTLTALEILGESFRFKTELQHDGALQADGTLIGNLYIRGGGDPTLGSDRTEGSLEMDKLLDLWTAKIKAAGIRRISGNVIADDGVFNANVLPNGWTWGDIGNYYGAAAFGLNINDNAYKVFMEPGTAIGSPTRLLRTEPIMRDVIFTNEVTTGPTGSGDQSYIYGVPYTYQRAMQGTIPLGSKPFVVRGSLPDPPLFAAQQLRETLQKNGIAVTGSATSVRLVRNQNKPKSAARTTFYTHLSPPLREIVKQTNLRSMNLYAEAMLKMIGISQAKVSTTAQSAEVVADFWERKGLEMAGFFMRDGSGLSRSNAMTVNSMANLLTFAAKRDYFGDFYRSFPVAGISGTMKSMGVGTAAEGNLRAKTGTLDRMSSYSGYFKTQSGELMAFAFIINDYSGKEKDFRKKAEKVLVLLPKL